MMNDDYIIILLEIFVRSPDVILHEPTYILSTTMLYSYIDFKDGDSQSRAYENGCV